MPLSFWLKLAGYLLTAGIGAFISHEIDQIPYDRQATAFESYKAQVADADAKAQKAAADALQAQINTRLTTESHNGQIVAQLTQERDSAALDRDFARRLLAAAQAKPRSGQVPAPGHQPATPDPAQPSGNGSTPDLARLVADSATECRDAIQTLTALQFELKPQL